MKYCLIKCQKKYLILVFRVRNEHLVLGSHLVTASSCSFYFSKHARDLFLNTDSALVKHRISRYLKSVLVRLRRFRIMWLQIWKVWAFGHWRQPITLILHPKRQFHEKALVNVQGFHRARAGKKTGTSIIRIAQAMNACGSCLYMHQRKVFSVPLY